MFNKIFGEILSIQSEAFGGEKIKKIKIKKNTKRENRKKIGMENYRVSEKISLVYHYSKSTAYRVRSNFFPFYRALIFSHYFFIAKIISRFRKKILKIQSSK